MEGAYRNIVKNKYVKDLADMLLLLLLLLLLLFTAVEFSLGGSSPYTSIK
jgi:hypothetical protein